MQWKSIGPGGGGWWTTIEVNPTDNDTVYVGCDVGGVYRTCDGGDSWKIINKGLIHYPVDDLLVDPRNTNVVYAATNGGVYKSIDGGDSWEQKRNGFPPPQPQKLNAPISCLHMHPTDSNIVYAGIGLARSYYPGMASAGTIYGSVDAGENWSKLNSGLDIHPQANLFSMASDPDDHETIYAATNYGVYKSTDHGYRWTRKINGLPYAHARQIIIHPDDPLILYVTLWYDDTTGANDSGVYKSLDGGDTWFSASSGLASLSMDIYWHLVMHPTNPDILYVGNQYGHWNTVGVYKTLNGGTSWTRVTTNNVDQGWIDFWGNNIQCLAISPNDPSNLYFGTSGIVAKTENGGNTWRQVYTEEISPGRWKGRGLENTFPYAVAVDHVDPDRVYVGMLDVSLLISEDGGISYRKVNKSHANEGADVFSITIDSDAPNTIYLTDGEVVAAGNYGNVWRSTNHGETWQLLSKKTPYAGLPYGRYMTVAIDRTSPVGMRTLYTACARETGQTPDGGVFKSTDGGSTWVEMNNGLPGNTEHVATLAVDPFDPQRIYAGVPVWWGHGTGGFFVSEDSGASWVKKALNLRSVWKIVPDPLQPGVVYVATSSFWAAGKKGGVFKSTNYGQSFTEMTQGMPPSNNLWVSDVAIDPHHTSTLFATTKHSMEDLVYYAGLFVSYNAAASWRTSKWGFTSLTMDTVHFDLTTPGRVFVGTSGNGLFVLSGK